MAESDALVVVLAMVVGGVRQAVFRGVLRPVGGARAPGGRGGAGDAGGRRAMVARRSGGVGTGPYGMDVRARCAQRALAAYVFGVLTVTYRAVSVWVAASGTAAPLSPVLNAQLLGCVSCS